MSKNNTASLLPFVQGRYIENSRWYMGSVMTFLVNSEHTNGSFSITEYLSKPGNEPPAHVHHREDEFFYILEGRIDAYIGKELLSAGQNEGVFFPKFIPHTFRILTPRLRMLIWLSPGGFEGYFRDMSEPARSLDLPTHAANYGEAGRYGSHIAAGKEHGISFLSSEEIRQQMPPLAELLALDDLGDSALMRNATGGRNE
ncbi:MAG TPA: cupin domain-containing protein [Xanthobacteraceae bacterium]|nr:cupin domain-containing protein [Xanthobacteraceae bacterium]